MKTMKKNKAHALKKRAAALITAASLMTLISAMFITGCKTEVTPTYAVTFGVEVG